MTQTLPESQPFVMAEWPEEPYRVVNDFTELMGALTDRKHEPETIRKNLGNVLDSPNTELFVIQEGDRIVSTATLSACPELVGSGRTFWIDDVVTHPDYLRRGHSQRIMGALEARVEELGGHAVYLTSRPDRGPARNSYKRRGYELLNESDWPTFVFRNTSIGNVALSDIVRTARITDKLDYSKLREVSDLLDEEHWVVRRNLDNALDSPTTAVFLGMQGDEVKGVAVANTTPIPVGMKPWVSSIAGEDPNSRHAVINAATAWIGKEYKHANIVASLDGDLPEGFVKRETGLYVKEVGRGALAGVRERE